MVKIMGNVLYHRLLPLVEPQLSPVQYAYRRNRGTEFLPTERIDYIHNNLQSERLVYILSFDVAGAFDSVPRSQLMRALHAMTINWHTRRVIHNWLRGCTFQAKLRTEEAVYMSAVHGISRGLLLGGTLSPLPLLIYFNQVPDGL